MRALTLMLNMGLTGLLAACSAGLPEPGTPGAGAVLFDPPALARADTLVMGVPGALTSIEILSPMRDWAGGGTAVAFYRLPGKDGRPLERLDLHRAAQQVAGFASASGQRHVRLVGYSTGLAISLEAAKVLHRADPTLDLRIVGLSSGLPVPQPCLASLRGARDIVASAARARSLNRMAVWSEYFRVLVHGRPAGASAEAIARADILLAERLAWPAPPNPGLARAHALTLMGWTNRRRDLLTGVPVALFHGDRDTVFPPAALRRMAARLPDATVTVLPGHAHLLPVTNPRVFDAARRFLGL